MRCPICHKDHAADIIMDGRGIILWTDEGKLETITLRTLPFPEESAN